MASAFPLPTAATPIERILSRFDRQQIADFIEVAISLLDVANDPDAEEDDPPEHNGDEGDWSTGEYRGRDEGREIDLAAANRVTAIGVPEDAEEDDPGGDTLDEHGEETFISHIMPQYGEDQTRGPINSDIVGALHQHRPDTWRG